MKYNFEKELLERHENKNEDTNLREQLSENEIRKIKEQYPNISLDFLDYLKEIGSGSFRECQFNVQKYLFDLDDVGLAEYYQIKKSIKFFGDNFSGDLSGFDFDNNPNLVIEFWHEDGTIYETRKTFKKYIQEQMLIGENGQDERV